MIEAGLKKFDLIEGGFGGGNSIKTNQTKPSFIHKKKAKLMNESNKLCLIWWNELIAAAFAEFILSFLGWIWGKIDAEILPRQRVLSFIHPFFLT